MTKIHKMLERTKRFLEATINDVVGVKSAIVEIKIP